MFNRFSSTTVRQNVTEVSTDFSVNILMIIMIIIIVVIIIMGRDSLVGIATRCGLDGRGFESRWGRHFAYLSRQALGPTLLPVQWVASHSWRYRGCGVRLTPQPTQHRGARKVVLYHYTPPVPPWPVLG